MSTGAAWAAPGRKNLINSSSISTTPQNIQSPPLRVLKFVPKVLGVLHLGGEGNREGLFNFPGVQGQPNTSENVFKSQDPHGGFYIWGGVTALLSVGCCWSPRSETAVASSGVCRQEQSIS